MQGVTNTLREDTGERRASRGAEADVHRLRSPGRQAVHDLAARLVIEYGGAVPPGRVTATVCRAYLTVVRDRVPVEMLLETCESIARRRLTDLVAAGLRPALGHP